MSSHIKNHLLRLRRYRGYSQKQLAQLVGLRSGHPISDFEAGRRLPPLKVAMGLEIVLGAKVSEMYLDLYRDLAVAAVKREARLPARFQRHIHGRVLGRDAA